MDHTQIFSMSPQNMENIFLYVGFIAFFYILPMLRNDAEWYDIAGIQCVIISFFFVVSMNQMIGVVTFLIGMTTLLMRGVTYRYPLLLSPSKW